MKRDFEGIEKVEGKYGFVKIHGTVLVGVGDIDDNCLSDRRVTTKDVRVGWYCDRLSVFQPEMFEDFAIPPFSFMTFIPA